MQIVADDCGLSALTARAPPRWPPPGARDLALTPARGHVRSHLMQHIMIIKNLKKKIKIPFSAFLL